jgi:hypothetical protein
MIVLKWMLKNLVEIAWTELSWVRLEKNISGCFETVISHRVQRNAGNLMTISETIILSRKTLPHSV